MCSDTESSLALPRCHPPPFHASSTFHFLISPLTTHHSLSHSPNPFIGKTAECIRHALNSFGSLVSTTCHRHVNLVGLRYLPIHFCTKSLPLKPQIDANLGGSYHELPFPFSHPFWNVKGIVDGAFQVYGCLYKKVMLSP